MAITSVGFNGSVSAVEFAQLSVHQGAMAAVVCGKSDLEVTANPSATLTCNVAPGASAGQGVKTTSTATEAVTFAAVVTPGQIRWDAVVLRRSWASAGSAALVVVPGTAGAGAPMVLPAGVDDSLDSIHDHVLALVQITYGNTVPTQVVDRRLQGSKVFTAPALSALPPASLSLYGMEAAVGGQRYRCLTDSGGTPGWIKEAPTVVAAGAITASAGWTVDPTFRNRYTVDPTGTDVQYEIQLRRSGAAVVFGASSNSNDTPVCVLNGPRPDVGAAIPVQFRIIGGSTTTSVEGIAAFGYCNGNVVIESGIPNSYLVQRTTVGQTSLQATIRFQKGA